jgi:peroxiredoxin
LERKPGEVITPPDRSERWSDQLSVGAEAPEFTLPLLPSGDKIAPGDKSSDQRQQQTVSLRELREKRPVVLIFGSITCPPFRAQLDGIDQVYEQFQDRAEFLFVYIREAHPDSVLSVSGLDGRDSLLKIVQAADSPIRTASAAVCQRTVKLSMPIAVDSIDNKVGKAYAGWPNRMVVVGTDGRVIYASPPSPRGTDAQRLRAWLEENVQKPGE